MCYIFYQCNSFDYSIFVLVIQTPIEHTCLAEVLDPIRELMADVKRKALMRLEYEGDCTMKKDHAAVYAMEKYAYYVCFKCKKVSQPHRQYSFMIASRMHNVIHSKNVLIANTR